MTSHCVWQLWFSFIREAACDSLWFQCMVSVSVVACMSKNIIFCIFFCSLFFCFPPSVLVFHHAAWRMKGSCGSWVSVMVSVSVWSRNPRRLENRFNKVSLTEIVHPKWKYCHYLLNSHVMLAGLFHTQMWEVIYALIFQNWP